MSFCPSKDIHSIYIDNEMPEIYKAEYEAHLKSCPECQKELEKLKKLRALFSSDSVVATPDTHYLDQSFERLQIKMKYVKNSAKEDKKNLLNIKYFIPSCAAAAAVLILALVLPLNLTKGNTSKDPSDLFNFNSQNIVLSEHSDNVRNISTGKQRKNNTKDNKYISFDSGRSVVISGNIEEPIIPVEKNKYYSNNIISGNAIDVSTDNNFLDTYEVFRPKFGEEKISIRITVPGVDDLPVSTEIELPLEVVVGQH